MHCLESNCFLAKKKRGGKKRVYDIDYIEMII
jgi:hypothetical protein